jgi:hypothetical protein
MRNDDGIFAGIALLWILLCLGWWAFVIFVIIKVLLHFGIL